LARLRLSNFRNYARLDLAFSPGFHLLLGGNAQGKTNLLEAVYLLATLRSFRGVGGAQMIRHDQKGYFAGGTAVSHTSHEVRMYWSLTQRSLSLDGQPVRRVTDYLGVVRAVVFCTEDVQLIKGPAGRRRRFLDLLLAQTYPAYLPMLQRYNQAMRSRNALLRQQPIDEAALESFTHELVGMGNQLMEKRRELTPRIGPLIQQAYRLIASEAEDLQVEYHPAVKGDFSVELAQSEPRERAPRLTLVGPHRDELRLLLDGNPAPQFASEGQKRSLAIAFKMAQAEHLASLHGFPPILLIDDVMGELDAGRRAALLPLLERAHHAQGQVFMTCTEENWPRELSRQVCRWEVKAGALREL
jgi:DNA replication and repair protein RecF